MTRPAWSGTDPVEADVAYCNCRWLHDASRLPPALIAWEDAGSLRSMLEAGMFGKYPTIYYIGVESLPLLGSRDCGKGV